MNSKTNSINYLHRLICAAIAGIISVFTAYAAERPFVYDTVRVQARGGLAVVDAVRQEMIVSNPAYLALAGSSAFTWDILSVRINHKGLADLADLWNIYSNRDIADAVSEDVGWEELAPELKDMLLSSLRPRAGIVHGIFFHTPHTPYCALGVSAIGSVRMDTLLDAGIFFPRVEIDAQGDAELRISLGRSVNIPYISSDGRIVSAGAGLKYLRRYSLYDTRTIDQFGEFDMDALLKKGYGVGADIGCVVRIEEYAMDAGVVLRDVFGTAVVYGKGDISVIPSRLDAGVSISPAGIPFFSGRTLNLNRKFSAGIQGKDITRSGQLWKKIHIGAEYTPLNFLSLRGGFGQGYPSCGIRIGYGLTLEYGLFAEERGAYAGHYPEWYHSILLSLQL